MNPLTLVKRIQNINAKEASLGISEEASWHAKYKDSAYVFVGGIPFDLTEGDLLAVFAQYGEIVDVNLVRDKGTGKSKGFAFVAYEDQRSTNLAVDNLNGAQVLGRIIRVDHVTNYKKKEEEDEEAERQKREARGVCRAFQRGECTRGAGCKFSHDEQRAANTGWGHQDHKSSRWGHDKFEGPPTSEKRSLGEKPSGGLPKQYERLEEKKSRGHNNREIDAKSREDYGRREEKRSSRHEDDEFVPKSREESYTRAEKRSRRYEDGGFVQKVRDDGYKREEKKSRRYEDDEVEPKSRDYDYKKEEKRSRRNGGVEYEPRSRDVDYRREDDRSRRHDEGDGSKSKLKDNDFTSEEKRTRRYDGDDFESTTRRDDDRKEEKSFRRHDSESHFRDDQEKRGRDSGHGRDTSSTRYRERR